MILAIDTATQMISLALHDGWRIRVESSFESAQNHTVELAPAVQHLLLQAGLSPANLAAIAVPLGPGSYTGLRIGMSFAKGLSLSQDPALPLIGLPTLEITARAQPPLAERLIAVAQAGRRRINAAHYRREEGCWQQDGDPVICTWPDLITGLERPTQIAGEIDEAAAKLLADAGEGLIISPSWANLRRASVLADMAWERLRRGDTDDPATLAPFYLT